MSDCISREAVLEINESHHGQMPNEVNHQIWKEIKELPPIKPKERAGEWINIINQDLYDYRTGNKLCFECSNCKSQFTYSSNYCPSCGRRMVAESEE